MVLASVLPLGLLQARASVEVGTGWARSAEFMQQPALHALRWLRIPGDTIFAVGALVLGWFVLGLRTGWSLERRGAVAPWSTRSALRKGRRPSAPEGHRRRGSTGGAVAPHRRVGATPRAPRRT